MYRRFESVAMPTLVRIEGAGRIAAGVPTAVGSVAICDTGVGMAIGIPGAAWSTDQVSTGGYEIWTGKPRTTLGGAVITSLAGKGELGATLNVVYDTVPPLIVGGYGLLRQPPAPSGPVVFNEVPNPAAQGQFSTLQPGPFAQESIPLEGVGRPASAAQQTAINEIGNKFGCHTCGSPSPGTQSGNWVLDHQPPTAMTLPEQSQVGYPHCDHCYRVQGGEVRAWQQ
jgi:hypothetical protein